MSKVVLLRCDSYDYSAVFAAVKKGIDLLGGPTAFASAGEEILLKPNWLAPDPPEKCATTHPMVFKAAIEALKPTNARLSYGDSPGFYHPIIAAKNTGFKSIADELGVALADFENGKEALFQQGIQNKKFTIAVGVLKSSGLISLPKLKTHGFQRFTGCIKNQFGCIPGLHKSEFHVKTQDVFDFARMLVDLNSFIKPRLYIMDGIWAMEGNGPRGGNPKKLSVLLLSVDPVALDATACRIINCNPELVPTIVAGKAAGAGTYAVNEIELAGDPIDEFIDRGFAVRREPLKPDSHRKLYQIIKKAMVPKPYIIQKKCIKCGICLKACPVNPKAIQWDKNIKKKSPSYNYSVCIRCFCCQELCPQSAIRLSNPNVRNAIFNLMLITGRIMAIFSLRKPIKKYNKM